VETARFWNTETLFKLLKENSMTKLYISAVLVALIAGLQHFLANSEKS
jgi:hypothetical protein